MLTTNRINCRLPQTPRTPSTAAAHYFDDIFSRSVKPPLHRRGSSSASHPYRHHIRRSSASRSIGARSDFATINGDNDNDNDEEEHVLTENGYGIGLGPEQIAADEHVSHYVASQIERVRSRGVLVGGYEDEFEAQVDGERDGERDGGPGPDVVG